ncbi:MAG: DUF4390 domain-containing protein [Burkholderiaceae bacterium]|nr:DUF4390 domain-containing protein [Sulfuritalea sp.]MCF8175563.1 DUF4390 domain-containing protein [Burkholderiaceae bacterium]MCF8183415.1 DUF4390 domain-containing protein [Polynucleobacter sp.]
MTAFITRCCKKIKAGLALLALLLLTAAGAQAGSIEPTRAALTPGEDGYTLSAEFAIDLGYRLEDAVARGVPLYFNLEFVLERSRKYWVDEHIATRSLTYRLSYSSLMRQYRLSTGQLHQNFGSLAEALRLVGRITALPVLEKDALKNGETYEAALRLALDRSQLPKPFQVDAITDSALQVDAKVLRWQFVAPPGTQ